MSVTFDMISSPEIHTPPVSLETLVSRVALGDELAFEELYRRTSAAVYGVVVRVLRDAAHAEEVAQEVFLEAWRTASRFDAARGKVTSWLLTLARGRAVDRVRSVQSSVNRDHRVARRDQPLQFDLVAELVASNLEAAQVRAGVATLSPKQQQAIGLAYFEGLTYREVAERLGEPLGTVKTRMRDGLIRLREHLLTAAE